MQLIELKENEMGRVKFVLELENGYTLEFGGESIAEIIYSGKTIEVTSEALADMKNLKAVYYELSEDYDGNGKTVYDIYKHNFIDGYNGLEIGESELISTWKRAITAQRHFDKLNQGL